MFGKNIRMERISDRNSGNCVIVPMDHGVSIVRGRHHRHEEDRRRCGQRRRHGRAHAQGACPSGTPHERNDIAPSSTCRHPNIGVTSNSKTLVATVEEALKYGADAVSVHINVGAETEPEMLADLGMVSSDCADWGMPLVVMSYPRGPTITNSYDPEMVAHAARVAMELGGGHRQMQLHRRR